MVKTENMYPTCEQLATVRAQGVIEPAKLKVGTSFIVETVKNVFEFYVKKDGLYVYSSDSDSISGIKKCSLAGSITKDGMLFAGMVVYDLHLIFNIPDCKSRYVTGLVKSACVAGDSWDYDLWGRHYE